MADTKTENEAADVSTPPPPTPASMGSSDTLSSVPEDYPRYGPAIITIIDRALGVFIIATIFIQPAEAFISTPWGAFFLAVAVLLELLFIVGYSVWEYHALRGSVSMSISVTTGLSALGLFLCVVDAASWLNCVGLFVVSLCRPTQAIFTAFTTYSTQRNLFTQHTRLRVVGRRIGEFIGVAASAIAFHYEGEQRLSAIRLVYGVACGAYLCIAFNLFNRCKRCLRRSGVLSGSARHQSMEENNPDNLFPPESYVKSMLNDTTTDRTLQRNTFEFMVMLYVFAGFWAMLAESLVFSYIVFFTGKAQTGGSTVAVFTIEALAVICLVCFPFTLDKRRLLVALRIIAGAAMIAIGCAVHTIEGEHMTTQVFAFAMCVLLSVPFLALTYTGDAYVLEAARMTLLGQTIFRDQGIEVFRPSRTVYQKVIGAQGLADMLACVIYAFLLPVSWKWRLTAAVVVGALLIYTALHVLNDERRITLYLKKVPAQRDDYKTGSIVSTWFIPRCFKSWTRLQTGNHAHDHTSPRPNAGSGGGYSVVDDAGLMLGTMPATATAAPLTPDDKEQLEAMTSPDTSKRTSNEQQHKHAGAGEVKAAPAADEEHAVDIDLSTAARTAHADPSGVSGLANVLLSDGGTTPPQAHSLNNPLES